MARDAALTALEKALRDALAAAPRDDVLQRVASALLDQLARGPSAQEAAAAVQRQVRHDLLGVLLDELEAEHGKVPEEVQEETRRMWPNRDEDK